MRVAFARRAPATVAFAAASLGLAFRLRVIALPTETLTARYLADDYFYYLNVAYNIAHGHGSSFDGGLTLTNGYQPLFLWCLVAVFWLGATKVAAIHVGLLIQALAAVVASLLAYKLLAARGALWAGALASGLLSLNLFFVLPTLTGFEIALALAALLLALWSWHVGSRQVVIGILCGLAALARVDNLVLPATFGLILVRQRRMRDLLWMVLGLLAVAGPWALWSAITFGHPLPDSGMIKAGYRGIDAVWQSASTAFLAVPRVIVPGRFVDQVMATARPALWVVSVLILLLAGRAALQKENRTLAIFAIGIAAAYACLIDPSEAGALVRYFFPVWTAIALLLTRRPSPVFVALVLALHAADQAVYLRWEQNTPIPISYVGASHTLAPAVIDRRIPAGVRIGSFDAGALGYFSPRPVVNLDGLANHDIVELRRHCRDRYPACLLGYMRSKGIGVLAGGTGFGWTHHFPDWPSWERIYESPPLIDGSRLVIVRLP